MSITYNSLSHVRMISNPMLRFHAKSLRLLAVLAATTLAATALAVPGGPPGSQGSFKVSCRGTVEGRGNAVLNANSLMLNLHLTDPATGATGHLVVPAVAVNNGRFNGTGDYQGQPVNVCGRIEAPDGNVVSSARICGSVAIPGSGGYARFVGLRHGS